MSAMSRTPTRAQHSNESRIISAICFCIHADPFRVPESSWRPKPHEEPGSRVRVNPGPNRRLPRAVSTLAGGDAGLSAGWRGHGGHESSLRRSDVSRVAGRRARYIDGLGRRRDRLPQVATLAETRATPRTAVSGDAGRG